MNNINTLKKYNLIKYSLNCSLFVRLLAHGHQPIFLFSLSITRSIFGAVIVSGDPHPLWSGVNNVFVQQETCSLLVAWRHSKTVSFKKKNREKLKMITLRSAWWRGVLWKWAPLVYMVNISGTWEKLRWGAYLCVRCRVENTVDVFKSMSQVVVSPADRPTLWGLLDLRWHGGRYGRQNWEKWAVFLSC